MNPAAKILSGIAGEYFVAGELSRRGYIASITLRNTANIDILASNEKKTVNIQVKTRCTEKADNWNFGGKPLEYKGKNKIFYVLVEIHSDINNKEIGYYIIPKNELNKEVEDNFQKWRKGKNAINGKPRKSNVRIFKVKDYPMLNIEKYKDNWDILFN